MNAWEVWTYHPPGWAEAHPCVIVSHPQRVLSKPEVNVVMCSSRRATRDPRPNEIILDQADGLDWPTICKCDLLLDVPRSDLKHRRGRVTDARRAQIIRTINRSMDWV